MAQNQAATLRITGFGYDRVIEIANGSYSWLGVEIECAGQLEFAGRIGCISDEPLTPELRHCEWPANLPEWIDRGLLHGRLELLRGEALKVCFEPDGRVHKLQDRDDFPFRRTGSL